MNEYGFGITIKDIEAYIAKDEAKKRTNHKNRENGETFGSELVAGALSFDAIYGEEFYNKAVRKNGASQN